MDIKIRIGILTLLLIGLGVFIVLSNRPSTILPTNTTNQTNLIKPTAITPTQPATPATAKSTAIGYYNFIASCLQNPASKKSEQIFVFCQRHNNYSGVKLITNLSSHNINGIEVLVCSQEPPQSAEPGEVTNLTSNSAQVTLKEHFTSGDINVLYDLEMENGSWKVQNISCK